MNHRRNSSKYVTLSLQLGSLLIILKANLKSEALKRIVDEKDEVQSKLNETSERVEQVNFNLTC